MSIVTLTGCDLTTRVGATETEATICREIARELPTRSRSDTVQTQEEITDLYTQFALVCPDHKNLIPK